LGVVMPSVSAWGAGHRSGVACAWTAIGASADGDEGARR
jgi:hypothetical protein